MEHEDAMAAFRRGDTEAAERIGRQALDRARSTGDVEAEVDALSNLARVAVRRGQFEASRELAAEGLERARASGRRSLEKWPTHILAAVLRMSGDLDAARPAYETSIALNRELGDSPAVGMEQYNLAYVELDTGHVDRARELFDRSRRQFLADDADDMLPLSVLATAVLADLDGDHLDAVRRLAVVDRWTAAEGRVLDPDDAEVRERLAGRLREALGEAGFAKGYQADPELSVKDALAG